MITIVSVVVLILGVVLLIVISLASRNPKLDRAYFTQKWQEIEIIHEGNSSDWYRAIIEADKLLDHALKAARYQGSTMGERLKDARNLKSINSAWAAHKLRNRLVHETNVKLNQRHVRAALNSYKRTLKDIGAIK